MQDLDYQPGKPLEQFCRDVTNHKMTILKDDGLYRHIRFAVPGYFENAFEIITAPETLMIRGDMGCYVFERVEDMFTFFRAKRTGESSLTAQNVSFEIKPDYWAEKVVSVARSEGLKEFSMGRFRSAVENQFADWKLSNALTNEAANEVWQGLEHALFDDEVRSVESAFRRISDVSGEEGYPNFDDFFEVDIEAFTYHYLWCCAAIAWSVAFYDKNKAGAI